MSLLSRKIIRMNSYRCHKKGRRMLTKKARTENLKVGQRAKE